MNQGTRAVLAEAARQRLAARFGEVDKDKVAFEDGRLCGDRAIDLEGEVAWAADLFEALAEWSFSRQELGAAFDRARADGLASPTSVQDPTTRPMAAQLLELQRALASGTPAEYITVDSNDEQVFQGTPRVVTDRLCSYCGHPLPLAKDTSTTTAPGVSPSGAGSDVSRFLRLQATYTELCRTVGRSRVRRFWETAEAAFTTVTADKRKQIEAARTSTRYEALLDEVGADCVEALRRDQDPVDPFPNQEDLQAAISFFLEQLPGFLETRLGQHHRVVSS